MTENFHQNPLCGMRMIFSDYMIDIYLSDQTLDIYILVSSCGGGAGIRMTVG